MKCNIIGAGRLGKNIALALYQADLISSLSICNRSLESAEKACQEIGFGRAIDKVEHLPDADITWICTNDDVIQKVVEAFAQNKNLKPGHFVIHSSGVLSSSILSLLRHHGCLLASFHPLKAFKTNYLQATAFRQVDCVLEGDPKVCDWLKNSFNHLDSNVINIKPEAKALYHAAACMASNYLITLAACSEELLLNAGMNPEQSRQMMIHLMQGNLNNLSKTALISESLTGPLARGDVQTIRLHLDSIENLDIKKFYQSAALTTLSLTQLSEETKEKISAICNLESDT